MTKKQQIQQLEAKVKELQKEHFDTLAELNKAKEAWRKEQENSKYWKELWEKQINENCDNKQRQETLNYIACSLANGLIIAKAINPDRPQLQVFNLSEYCVKLAKEIMEQAEKNT